MITKLHLKNFKSIEDQEYNFGLYDLLLGRNNSGKSTILQAIAIWQFCVEEFGRSGANRKGSSGIQIILPSFTALPLPEFNLLWRNRSDRFNATSGKGKEKSASQYILIHIGLTWTQSNQEHSLAVDLRYQSPQSIYAIPVGGWAVFKKLKAEGVLPNIAYVPPFSGLEPIEEWRDDGPMRKQVGKAQPGSVLRNLLYRVFNPSNSRQTPESGLTRVRKNAGVKDWEEIVSVVKRWFTVTLQSPNYRPGVDTQINLEYRKAQGNGNKDYDIISGGSGFHQTLTLLAFLYGYKPTTILLDEPDAHLHTSLQREVMEYFREKSTKSGVQFLIATHAEEVVRGVSPSQIISLLSGIPSRLVSSDAAILALSQLTNQEIVDATDSRLLVYVEGEDDERILKTWAGKCNAAEILQSITFKVMGGGSKENMVRKADENFNAITQFVPRAKRIVLLDRDEDSTYHPASDNPVQYEWKRRSIDNYLLVPDAWRRVISLKSYIPNVPMLIDDPVDTIVVNFFQGQNLTLPPNATWRNVSAQVFAAVDGKSLLFSGTDSLFQQVRRELPKLELSRKRVAEAMTDDEIHQDIHDFFARLKTAVGGAEAIDGVSAI